MVLSQGRSERASSGPTTPSSTPDISSVSVLVWGEEIGEFPVERPAFGAFQPADGDGAPLMPLFQPDPQAGIPVPEIAVTVGAVGYIPAFNKKYLNPHCKIDHTLI